MTHETIDQQEPIEPTGITLDRKCIAEAKMAVIVCASWVILAPFAIWFGIAHLQNFWLAIIPLVFGCIAFIPLMGFYALVIEYRAALHGQSSE